MRYRGAIPEARTKWEAEQAENKIRREVYEGRFGLVQSGTMKLSEFIDEIYMTCDLLNGEPSLTADRLFLSVLNLHADNVVVNVARKAGH